MLCSDILVSSSLLSIRCFPFIHPTVNTPCICIHSFSVPSSLHIQTAGIYNSPLLEDFVVKTFLEALPPPDAELSRGEVVNWEALVWRQWTVGDVVRVLNSFTVPTSIIPETPPELAFFMEKAGIKVFDYTATSRYLPPTHPPTHISIHPPTQSLTTHSFFFFPSLPAHPPTHPHTHT